MGNTRTYIVNRYWRDTSVWNLYNSPADPPDQAHGPVSLFVGEFIRRLLQISHQRGTMLSGTCDIDGVAKFGRNGKGKKREIESWRGMSVEEQIVHAAVASSFTLSSY